MKKVVAALAVALALVGAVGSPAQASGDQATITAKKLVWKSFPTPHLYALVRIGSGWSEVTLESYALCDVGEAWPSCTSWWAGYSRSPYKG